MLSLLDVAHRHVATWYVIFTEREGPRIWNRFIRKDFGHVYLVRPVQYGPELSDVMWLKFEPGLEAVELDIEHSPTPPWGRDIAQRVVAAPRSRVVRDWFHVGPMTCVELAKAVLGIRSFWTRTPYQLYKYIAARNGVLLSR